MKTLILFYFLFLVKVYGLSQRLDPLVMIDQGLVKGIVASDGDYSKFLGIPYGVVDLTEPFGVAQPAPKFKEETFHATDYSSVCPQPTSGADNGSPDCLRLNIHVPNKASTQNPLPVLVWIHGGAYIAGSGNRAESPNLVKQDIILVTVNYRLGAYGFMCLDDPAVPGNQGLKDVHLALQWVKKNIGAFGGNPNNVTLGGQSAGSALVLLQLFSSKEKLYNKVIAQSGSHLSLDFFTKGDPLAALKLASYLGLNTTDNQQALAFLAKTHHSLVVGAALDLKMDFKPCTENFYDGVDPFIVTDPYSLTNEKKIRNTPILIGNTDEEYLSTSIHSIKWIYGDDFLHKDFFYSRLSDKYNMDDDELAKAAELLRHFYIGDKPFSEAVEKEAENFVSDFIFNHPIQDAITSLIKENANPIFEYAFTYVGDSGAVGAAHSDDLQFLFNRKSDRASVSDGPLLVERMVTMWSNFIKYGNPVPETTELLPVVWTPVTASTRPYLNIGSKLVMEDRFYKERNAFWDLFQSVYGKYSYLIQK